MSRVEVTATLNTAPVQQGLTGLRATMSNFSAEMERDMSDKNITKKLLDVAGIGGRAGMLAGAIGAIAAAFRMATEEADKLEEATKRVVQAKEELALAGMTESEKADYLEAKKARALKTALEASSNLKARGYDSSGKSTETGLSRAFQMMREFLDLPMPAGVSKRVSQQVDKVSAYYEAAKEALEADKAAAKERDDILKGAAEDRDKLAKDEADAANKTREDALKSDEEAAKKRKDLLKELKEATDDLALAVLTPSDRLDMLIARWDDAKKTFDAASVNDKPAAALALAKAGKNLEEGLPKNDSVDYGFGDRLQRIGLGGYGGGGIDNSQLRETKKTNEILELLRDDVQSLRDIAPGVALRE